MRGPSLALLVGLALLAAFSLAEPLYAGAFRVPASYVEGWVADHAARVQHGGALYDTSNLLRLHNYPPLYALLLAHAGGPESDLILLGRSISVLSTFAASAAVFSLGLALGNGAFGSGVAALVFLGFVAGVFPGYVAANDPTLLGHALMTSALALFASRWQRPSALLAVAALVCLAGFFKHNLVAAPLAMTLFLALRDRRQLAAWLICASAILALAIGVTSWIHGGEFLESLISPRRIGFERLIWLAPRRLLPLLPAIAIWLVWWLRERSGDRSLLIGIYCSVSLSVGLFFTLGDGVHHNVLYDAVIGLALALGAAVQGLSQQSTGAGRVQAAATLGVPLLACAPLLLAAPARIAALPTLAGVLSAAERETRLDLTHLQLARRAAARAGDSDAALLCENPALCYWAGAPAQADLFSARQAFLQNPDREADFIARIDAQEFSAIQLYGLHTSPRSERLSPELLDAIERNYRAHRKSGNGFFLGPRGQPSELDE